MNPCENLDICDGMVVEIKATDMDLWLQTNAIWSHWSSWGERRGQDEILNFLDDAMKSVSQSPNA